MFYSDSPSRKIEWRGTALLVLVVFFGWSDSGRPQTHGGGDVGKSHWRQYDFKAILLGLQILLSFCGSSNATQTLYGLNMSGAEFGDEFGAYGTAYIYPGSETIGPIVAKGFKIVRLPIKWERIQNSLFSPLNSAELSRLTSTIALANSKGLSVIVDVHNFGEYRNKAPAWKEHIGDADVPISAFADLWSRMAAALIGKPGIAGYDIMNEPQGLSSPSIWPEAAQAAINAIRSVDKTTTIYVEGDCWSGAWDWQSCNPTLASLADPSNRIIFEAHQYFDANSSGTYANSYDGEGAYPDVGVDRVKPFVDWLKANNLPGIVGEYGVPDNDPRWLTVLDNFLSYLASTCVSGTYWSSGPWWGSYPLSVQPINGMDRPQMAVLKNYTMQNCSLLLGNPSSFVASLGGRTDAFVRSSDNGVWHQVRSGSTLSGFVSLGIDTAEEPAAVASGLGVVDVFVVGEDDQALWHSRGNGDQYGAWESLGGAIVGRPSVTSWAPNRLDVFVRGTDDYLYHKAWNGNTWASWQSLQVKMNYEPVAISSSANHLDVFFVGKDNALYHSSFSGSGWSAPQSLGGSLSSSPTAIAWANNRFEVFARGSDMALWHQSFSNGRWSGWQSLSGGLDSAPTAMKTDASHMNVTVVGSDTTLWGEYFNGSGWSGWIELSQSSIGNSVPGLVPTGPANVSVAGIGANSAMYLLDWDPFQVSGVMSLGGSCVGSLGVNP